MPKHAQVIYETGAKSVVSYDDLDDLKAGLAEHHRRAIAGEPGGPAGNFAERVSRVLLYDEHPADLNAGNTVDVDKLRELVSGMETAGSVSAAQLTEAIRDEVSPVYPVDQGPHESMYKMPAKEELDVTEFLPTSGDM